MSSGKAKQKSTSATQAKPSPGQKQKANNNKSTTPGKKRATPAAEPNTAQLPLAKKIESVRRVTNWPADEDILRVLQESNFNVEVAIDKILSGDAGHPGQEWTEVSRQKKSKEPTEETTKKVPSASKLERPPSKTGGRGTATGPGAKNGRTSENGKGERSERRDTRDQRRDPRATGQKPPAKAGRGAPPPRSAPVRGQEANYHPTAAQSALQASALAATVTPGQTFASRVAAQAPQSFAPPTAVSQAMPASANVVGKEEVARADQTATQGAAPVARPPAASEPAAPSEANSARPPAQPSPTQQPAQPQAQPQTQTQRPHTPPQAQTAVSTPPQDVTQPSSDYAPSTAQIPAQSSPVSAKPPSPALSAAQTQGPIGSPSQGKASQQFAKGPRRGETHWKPVQKKESLPPAHASAAATQSRPQEALGANLGLMQGGGDSSDPMALLDAGQEAESFLLSPDMYDRKEDAPFQFGNFGLAPAHKEEPSVPIRQAEPTQQAAVRQQAPVRATKEKDQLELSTQQSGGQQQPTQASVQAQPTAQGGVPKKRSTEKKQPQYRTPAAPQLTEESMHMMGGGLGGPYPYGHFPFMPQVVPYPLDMSDPAVQAQAHPQMFYDQSQFQGSTTYRTTSTVAPEASKYHAPTAAAYRDAKYTPHAHQGQAASVSSTQGQGQSQDRDRTSNQAQSSPQSPPPVQAQQPPPYALPGASQYPAIYYPYQFTYPAATAAGSQYAYAAAGQRMPFYKTYSSGSGYPVSPPGSSSLGSGAYTEDISQDYAAKYQQPVQQSYFFPADAQQQSSAQATPGAGKAQTHAQPTHQHQAGSKTQQQHASTQSTQLAYAPPDLPAAYKADYSAAPGGGAAADGQSRGSPSLSMGHAGSSYYSPQAYAGHYAAQGHQAYAYLQQHPQSHPGHAHLLQAQGQNPQASQFS